MSNLLPPSPVDAPFGAYNWADWYEKIRRLINQVTIIAWSQISDFTGSNLNQIATRLHNSLQSIQGGNGTNEFYHLTNADFTTLSGVTFPLSVAKGGNGTATPALVAGTNITITGTWPALTINAGGGSGTVTHTVGNLTAGALVVGNAVADIKVSTTMSINANNGMVIAAPTGSTTPAIAITMPANTSGGITITGPIAGSSRGIFLTNMGNSSADPGIQITNVNGITYCQAFGDGHFVLGSNGASGTPGSILGAATGDITIPLGSLTVIGSTKGLGYGTGAGGTVTQITSSTTGVTLNKSSGQIVCLASSSPGIGAPISFTLTNSTIAATDTVICNVLGSTTAQGKCMANAEPAAGSAVITIANQLLAGAGGDSLKINFNVIKGVTS